MGIDISTKTETRLAAKAGELGLSIDALLERLMNENGDLTDAAGHCTTTELSLIHI